MLENILNKFNPTFDMPKESDLIMLIPPTYYDDDEILVGNRDYLSYNKICVPFILYENKYYEADMSESIPHGASDLVANCRKYVLVENETEIDKKYVYEY